MTSANAPGPHECLINYLDPKEIFGFCFGRSEDKIELSSGE